MLRTALVIEVPASAVLLRLRKALASDAAAAVPPHVTILFPFAPMERLDKADVRSLRSVIGSFRRFDYVLDQTGWFGDDVLWLAPVPSAPFASLTAAICKAFPLYPPYGGLHDEPLPHVTVGDSGSVEQLRAAEREVRGDHPLRGSATSVTLLAETEGGFWKRAMVFPLAAET